MLSLAWGVTALAGKRAPGLGSGCVCIRDMHVQRTSLGITGFAFAARAWKDSSHLFINRDRQPLSSWDFAPVSSGKRCSNIAGADAALLVSAMSVGGSRARCSPPRVSAMLPATLQ